MSGVEAALVLGLAASVITICETANDLWQAAHDAKGLPKKLKLAADELPLVLVSLEQAHSNIDAALKADTVELEIWQKVHQILKSCDESAKDLQSLFDECLPSPDDDRTKRWAKVLQLRRKSGQAEKHIQQIFRHIQALAEFQILRDSETLEDVKAAITALEALDEEERGARAVHHGEGDIIEQTGSGSNIRTYKNTGTASMFNAETQYIGKGTE